ncbi:methionine aminopeptidase [Yersinia massiliensis]|uniref:Methionine aminopeptidase n=1 Tax=Yersinia massiliensis TaxID=419257 RepID=A0ABM6UQ22_9GAMM|nr:methionine aminopeptidase [Yersinia massiliensis]
MLHIVPPLQTKVWQQIAGLIPLAPDFL